jgi:hypothetical protein
LERKPLEETKGVLKKKDQEGCFGEEEEERFLGA